MMERNNNSHCATPGVLSPCGYQNTSRLYPQYKKPAWLKFAEILNRIFVPRTSLRTRRANWLPLGFVTRPRGSHPHATGAVA